MAYGSLLPMDTFSQNLGRPTASKLGSKGLVVVSPQCVVMLLGSHLAMDTFPQTLATPLASKLDHKGLVVVSPQQQFRLS
jgi:hypothetical protein